MNRHGAWRLGGFLALASAACGQITESPLTVKPGRFLLEMDAISVSWNRDEPANGKYTAVAVASTFLTTGLSDRVDVQIGADLFVSQKVDIGGLRERDSGVGDVYLRAKMTILGDDTTSSAMAVLPYVKLPTNNSSLFGNDSVEGGVIVPWMWRIPGGGHVHAMGQVDLRRNDADDGYDVFSYFSAALDRPLTGAIGLYGELTAAKGSGGGGWAGTMGGGVTVALRENVWWDFAVYRGITRAAADWNPVVRFNWGF